MTGTPVKWLLREQNIDFCGEGAEKFNNMMLVGISPSTGTSWRNSSSI
jgi:hypothetical protein